MTKSIRNANKLIVIGCLIPLLWFLIYCWIESASQNNIKDLATGIVVVGTFAIMLLSSLFFITIGLILSVRELLLDKKSRATVNLLFAGVGAISFFAIIAYMIFFLCF